MNRRNIGTLSAISALGVCFGIGALATGGLISTSALSQSANQRQPMLYLTSPLEGDATREVRMHLSTLPPGGSNNFHRHPGDQWALIQEGEVTFTIKGQPPRLMKAGDSVYIPRGTIHRNQNLGSVPSRAVEVMILDKGKPLLEQMPD